MAEAKTTLAKIGTYDGYIVEIRYPDGLSDEVTDTLDRNFTDMARDIGEDNVYIQLVNRDAEQHLIDKLGRNLSVDTMPWLVLLDRHPNEMSEGEECLILELGEARSEREVIIALRKACKALNDEQFMSQLSSEQRRAKMVELLSPVAKISVQIASFL